MTLTPSREHHLQGVPASDGVVVGPAHLLHDVIAPTEGDGGPAEQQRAAEALITVAALLGEAGARLRAAGRDQEAEILEASQLMAEDPSLLDEVTALAATRPAAAALFEATDRHATLLAAIPDPYLAARATDVRRLGRQAARLLDRGDLTPPPPLFHERRPMLGANIGGADITSAAPDPRVGAERRENGDLLLLSHRERGPGGEVILARDLGPADLAEIELSGIDLGGIALAEGSVTSHAAIAARSLGVPLAVGLGDRILDVTDGALVVLNGTTGSLVLSPEVRTIQAAGAEIERLTQHRARLAAGRSAGIVTRDGHAVRLLVNASTERELLAGLDAGAEGVGLLRTELSFLDAAGWPTDAQHEAAVRPLLGQLSGRIATVRTLDFGADKTPPFLRGRSERGIALHLDEPDALAAQLRGLLRARGAAALRIMLPLVEQTEQLAAARELLGTAHAATTLVLDHVEDGGSATVHRLPLSRVRERGAGGEGWMRAHHLRRDAVLDSPLPLLGAMIETRAAVQRADAIAAAADFLSIGTNDLVQDLLGLDRLTPAATVRSAADPRVLRAVHEVAQAAGRHGRSVEVCGEAAGDARIALLFVGLGVSELSVAPSRLDEVRAAIQAATLTEIAAIAQEALALDSAEAVLALVAAALAGQLAHEPQPQD